MNGIEVALEKYGQIINSGLDARKTNEIFSMLKLPNFPEEFITFGKLMCEYEPLASEVPYTEEIRCLHFLWDSFNASPLKVIENFAIPFRRMIAKKLFKKCGENFVALSNCTFYFPNNIEVGDNVLFHRNTFIDAQGGVVFENNSVIGEGCKIYTHHHLEEDPRIETHGKVVLKDSSMVYAESIILHNVTINENAIVGAKSIVTKDVPANVLVAGCPASVIRERKPVVKDYEYDVFKVIDRDSD